MRKTTAKSALLEPATTLGEGPLVLSLIEGMTKPRAAILTGLREAALSLPGVEERTVFDGFCREWTPAYYEGGRQLFHVHNFRAALRATMFVGIRTLKPFLLDSDRLAPELLQLVASGSGGRGTMQLKVPLESMRDVAPFMELVCRKLKYAPAGKGHAKPGRGSGNATPR